MGDTDPNSGKPHTTSFMVEVKFRRNTSMQGDITWLEREKNRHFRSLLELIALIQEACEATGAPSAGLPAAVLAGRG